ncbi:UNVERIFIED_ORG: hypothetical protein J2W74_005209 [Methylorubrum zatmanii]
MSGVLSPRQADLMFFRRFPGRLHRIRIAARSEIEHASQKGALALPTPAGFRAHIGVARNGRGRLQYAVGILCEGADCDMAEAEARDAFALLLRQDGAQPVNHHQQEPAPLPRRNDA